MGTFSSGWIQGVVGQGWSYDPATQSYSPLAVVVSCFLGLAGFLYLVRIVFSDRE